MVRFTSQGFGTVSNNKKQLGLFMIFNMANKLAAMALAMGCILAPAAAHAQAAAGKAEQNDARQGEGITAMPSDDGGDANRAVGAGDEHVVPGQDQQADGGTATEAPAQEDAPHAAGGGTEADAEDGIETSVEARPEVSREAAAAGVKAVFEEEFPGIVLDSVRPTRFADIYELRIGSDLLYTNEKVEYVMQGSLIDARNKEDLTAKSMDELMKVSFDSLPLKSAIKQVKGDGSRKLVVFEDPNCGYCKRLHQTLESMDNYTVYTLLFPILSPDSTEKARNIWCAADRVQAWRNQMLKNQAPSAAQCDTPIEANLALGRKLLVRGTPAIFFEDGSRVNGALPREGLEERLDAATAALVR